MPKSMSAARRVRTSMSTLSGLMSRWKIPYWRLAASTPSQIGMITSCTSRVTVAQCLSRGHRCAVVPVRLASTTSPSVMGSYTSSITKYRRSSCVVPRSYTGITCGCRIFASASHSARNRSFSRSGRPGSRTLIATLRFVSSSNAL